MQRTIAVIRVRFPTGREEDFIGRDFKTQNALKKAYQAGAATVAVREYLCKCTDAEFFKIASSKDLKHIKLFTDNTIRDEEGRLYEFREQTQQGEPLDD